MSSVESQSNTLPGSESYGGFSDPVAKPTGYFCLANVKGRDMLLTPDGKPFVALGVNHIGVLASQKQDIDWNNVLVQYRTWGCTTVGSGDGPVLSKSMPYVASSNFARTSKYYTGPTGNNPYDYPDVFEPRYQARLRAEVQRFCDAHRDNPRLVGYCWTDTPCWDIVRTRALRRTDWVSEIRKLGMETPGKRRYVQFLRDRYRDNFQKLSELYGEESYAFEELLKSTFHALDASNLTILQDDKIFLGIIAQQYYVTIGTAQREFDPRHLVFGEKYLAGDCPDEVLLAALPHIDVLSIQPGDGYIDVYPPSDVFQATEFDRLFQLAGKPIFICDHQISFVTEAFPKTTWTQLKSEADAAVATHRFMLDAFTKPYIIGYMRCQYIDAFDKRRAALKQGLLRQDGTPYSIALEAFQSANHKVVRHFQ